MIWFSEVDSITLYVQIYLQRRNMVKMETKKRRRRKMNKIECRDIEEESLNGMNGRKANEFFFMYIYLKSFCSWVAEAQVG